MLKSWQYWLLLGLGALALILTGANIGFYYANRSVQQSLSARAQYLQQTGPIRDLYQEMAKELAELSIKNHDEQLEAMLAGEGLRISPTSANPAQAKWGAKP